MMAVDLKFAQQDLSPNKSWWIEDLAPTDPPAPIPPPPVAR